MAEDFTAFRRLVPDDPVLVAQLRSIMDPATFVVAVVAAGAARGFHFVAADVEAVSAANRHGWLRQWPTV